MREAAGEAESGLRVAIVGSGPAGFYTAQHLLRSGRPGIRVDMFEALPTPFGLVRHGVAPDHAKIKSVAAVYHKLALDRAFRFFGNVEYGKDLSLDELESLYHHIVFCTGAQSDRHLGIPGEELRGSHSATEFVAWYNGHPDFSRKEFDLACTAAVVIGAGNVAVDVARILCRTPAELAATDIADYALHHLSSSRVRSVHLVGRRGPLQAAFTNPEVKELGELGDAECSTLADEVELDALSRRALEAEPDKAARRKIEILASYAGRRKAEKSRRLFLRFLLSPVEILGDPAGRVRAVRLVRNELWLDDDGVLRARPTERGDTIEAGLVLRSVGYRGVPLPGLPFDERRAIVPNRAGRVIDPADGRPLPGIHVSGWIKRGPSGVIGTNKPDAAETVRSLLEDAAADRGLHPDDDDPEAVVRRLRERAVRFVSYDDWLEIDAREIARGKATGRPRIKFTDRAAFLSALDRR